MNAPHRRPKTWGSVVIFGKTGSRPRSGNNAAPPETRLSCSLSGTNLARAGDYNLRTVLQAIRLNPGTTRVAIAAQTGLTAPTIANITGRLSDMDLVRTTGRRHGGRGQPALQLEVNADGAFAIGLTIDRDHLTMVTLDLVGTVRSRATREIAFAMPSDVTAFVAETLDRLVAEGGVDRDRVLGVGIAMPDDLGSITLPHRPADYDRCWTGLDIDAHLAPLLPWPIHVDNDAAAAALGEAQHGTAFETPSFFYLLVSAGLGGGLVIDRNYHRGAHHRSGEIGLMPDLSSDRPGAVVQDTVSLSALFARLYAAGLPPALATLVEHDQSEASAVIDQWLTDSIEALGQPLVAIACLFDPDAVLIGGRLPMPLVERLATGLTERLAGTRLPVRTPVLPATMAQDAPAVGAAILPFLAHLLPSDAKLIQAGR